MTNYHSQDITLLGADQRWGSRSEPPLAAHVELFGRRRTRVAETARRGLSYSGSYSTGGVVATNFNRFAGDLIDGKLDRLNPGFGSMTYVVNSNVIHFNSMIASVRQRLGERLSLQASYTLGYATDYYQGGSRANGVGNVPDPSDLRRYRADSSYDIRNHFSALGVYRVPTPFKKSTVSRYVLGGVGDWHYSYPGERSPLLDRKHVWL